MEHIEHTAITTFHTPPSLWLRYVEDTFCILDKEHVTAFHSYLNSMCSSIEFTMESEKTPLFLFLTFWYLVKLAMRVTLLIYQSPLPSTKNLLTVTDICIIRHITPNTKSSLWSKRYLIALTHTSPTIN